MVEIRTVIHQAISGQQAWKILSSAQLQIKAKFMQKKKKIKIFYIGLKMVASKAATFAASLIVCKVGISFAELMHSSNGWAIVTEFKSVRNAK